MQKFIRLYRILDKQCGYYSRHLGHLKGLLKNNDWLRVVDDSMTGRVLVMSNSEITNALILFNTRMFDQGKDTSSLRHLGSCVPTEAEIVNHHLKRMKDININYSSERYFQPRRELLLIVRRLKSDTTSNSLKQLRDFVLAHNIEPNKEQERATLIDLIQLTETVFEAVDIAGYLVDSSRGSYRDFVARSETETREFYSILPKLSDVENL